MEACDSTINVCVSLPVTSSHSIEDDCCLHNTDTMSCPVV